MVEENGGARDVEDKEGLLKIQKERIFIERMTSNRKLKASREGSK